MHARARTRPVRRRPRPHGRDSPQFALGSCFTYFQHPFSAEGFSWIQTYESFFATVLQPETLAIHGTWQAGCDRRAHGEDIRLKSSASASEWHEYRGPRNPLILQDVSASFGGLGVIQRLGPTSRVCAQNGQRTKRAILVTHNSDDGRYSNSEICRTSDLRRRPCSLRGHIFADRHALDHPHTTASASPTDRDAAAIKPKSVRHADPA